MTDKDLDDRTAADEEHNWNYLHKYENRLPEVSKDTSVVGHYEYSAVGRHPTEREIRDEYLQKMRWGFF